MISHKIRSHKSQKRATAKLKHFLSVPAQKRTNHPTEQQQKKLCLTQDFCLVWYRCWHQHLTHLPDICTIFLARHSLPGHSCIRARHPCNYIHIYVYRPIYFIIPQLRCVSTCTQRGQHINTILTLFAQQHFDCDNDRPDFVPNIEKLEFYRKEEFAANKNSTCFLRFPDGCFHRLIAVMTGNLRVAKRKK